MTTATKLIAFEEAAGRMDAIRRRGRRIVQCHGTFDLVHPGHIIFFEEAKALGDVLVVTITGEAHVNKGPGRPYFNDHLRMKSLAALECVDHVVVIPFPAAVEAIECIRPHVYCKGKEYSDPTNDVTGNIHDDVETVSRIGGEICYVGSVVFSSTKLINRHFDVHPKGLMESCREVAATCPPDRFRTIVEDFSKLRVLVVGDIIFDRYTSVAVQGLTSKNRIISTRHLSNETQPGGALAVFRHIKQFTPHVKIAGLVGVEPWVDHEIGLYVAPDEDEILRSHDYTTVVKQRFVEPQKPGQELSKLFSINYLDPQPPSESLQNAFCERLMRQILDYDLVLVMDFGHGTMEDPVRELVQQSAAFMAVNCQTNSSNYGFNIINRRYSRADSFSLDKTEITLATGRRQFDPLVELNRLQSELQSSYAWVTQGDVETLGICSNTPEPSRCPPLESDVVDTVGAGDAFCSLASLAAVAGVPLSAATFLGQLAGAQAVKIVGNRDPVSKAKLLKSGISLLTF
jgi:rfaE bifunctional protein nucleotidyltransferase chain/domain